MVLITGSVNAVWGDVHGEGSHSMLQSMGLDVFEARYRSS